MKKVTSLASRLFWTPGTWIITPVLVLWQSICTPHMGTMRPRAERAIYILAIAPEGVSYIYIYIIFLQYALVELFGWWEEHHLIKANWSTVTKEHGLRFVTIFMMKRLQ